MKKKKSPQYSVANIRRRLIQWLKTPFSTNLGLMAIWFLLMAGPDCYFFIQSEEYIKIPYYLSRGFLAAYIFSLIYDGLYSRFLRKPFAVLIFLLIFCFYLVDIFCIVNLKDRYSYDMAAVILGTNANETGEFLQTYLSIQLLIIIFLSIFACIALFKIANIISRKKYIIYIGMIFVAVSLYYSITNNYMLNGIYAKYHSFFEFPELPDLKAHEKDPLIICEKGQQPQNVVIIIGEAFAKSHCSLYGYDKPTNPLLKQLENDSALLVYKHVMSPATHTLQAFQYILNTYQLGREDKTDFAESITLANVAKHAGYKTYWVSNQSKHGQNDNLVGLFADLCDKEEFVDNKFTGLTRWTLDGQVLPVLKSIISEKDSLKFYFVHLMGSHFNCRERYPDNFDKFKEKDYSMHPEHQRRRIAEYDNSVLYNDYVVANIMQLFKSEESVIVYFPDHGMDVYESSDDWYGHARDADPASVNIGRQIPFVIYMSPSYIKHFSQNAERMKANINKDFCTDKLVYTVMDLMNVTFRSSDDVERFSLLSCVQDAE